MRKVLSITIMLFGTMIIGMGIFFQTSDANTADNSIQKKKLSYAPFNIFNEEQVCTAYQDVSTFINLNNGDMISFSYPDCVKEYDLSFWSKNLISEDKNIEFYITKVSNNATNYLEIKRKKIENDDNYINVNTSNINTFVNDNNLEISFIQTNYQKNNVEEETNYDSWYIAIKIDNDNSLVWEIVSRNGVFPYSVIGKIFNSLKITKSGANLVNTTKKEDFQVGYIYQNIDNSYQHGYKINLKIPNKYMEVKSYKTDFDESIFQYQNANESIYIDLSIDKDSYRIVDEKIDLSHKTLVANRDNNDWKNDIVDTGVVAQIIDNKQVYYSIYSYYDNNGDSNYLTYVYYEVANGFFYKIYISSSNVVIDEEFISQFLDFSVEEY